MERDATQDVIPYRVQEAKEHGLHAAIILAQLRYWLERTTFEDDSRKWVFKSYRQWGEETGLTKSQAQRGCYTLERAQVIESTTRYSDPRKGPPT